MKFQIGQVFRALSTCAPCEHSTLEGGALCCQGKPINVFDEAVNCPLGKWKSEIKEPQTVVRGFAVSLLGAVVASWKEAAAAVAKGPEFFSTVLGGLTDDETVARREAQCNACPKMERRGTERYCRGGCDCHSWPVSELDTKLRFAKLRCPQKRPGFYEG